LYHGDWGWGVWLVLTLVMIAFWGFVIWAVATLVRTGVEAAPRRRSPEGILAERLARGEIDEHEYRRALDKLPTRSPDGHHEVRAG